MAASEGARIEGSSPFTVSQPLNNQLVGTSLILLHVLNLVRVNSKFLFFFL